MDMGGIDLQVISDIGTTLSVERGGEGPMRSENPGVVVSGALPRLEPLRSVRTDALEVTYFEAGPSDGEVEHLLHGSPYDIHSYVDVNPRLVEAGHRVITPYLRGHGPTRFLDSTAPRSGQQAAIGTDVVALMDALERLCCKKSGSDAMDVKAHLPVQLRPPLQTGWR